MVNKKITVNAVLNVIKTGLSIIFPILTYPYAARILGADGIGMISYVGSIINYFVLFASFGISGYATREGAKIRWNKKAFQNFFDEINAINMRCTLTAYVVLILFVFVMKPKQEYLVLFAILGSEIFFKTFSFEWINVVYEDFAYITIRSIITNIVSLVLLFAVVKRAEDVYLYAIITVITYGINCCMNLWYCRKYVRIRIVKEARWHKHIISLFYFLANDVAISVYVNIDTTMLGYFKGDYEVGVYTIAVKIYTVIKKVLAAIYAVTIPKLSEYVEKKQIVEFRELYTKLCAAISILLLPASTGLFAMAEELIYFMGGNGYAVGVLSLKILSVGLVFAIYGGLVTACFNVVQKREKTNFYATIIGALLNIVLNFFFIPRLGQYGAAFTTAVSEATVFLICFVRLREKEKYINIGFLLKEIRNAIMGSLLIYLWTVVVHHMIMNRLISCVAILAGSIIIYFIWLYIVRDIFLLELKLKLGNTRKIRVDN